jgi:chromosome segregation ATPase
MVAISEKPGVPSAVDAEVSKHLAERLATVQDELFNAKRRISSLDAHVALLQDDVNQKKEMIRNFVRRIETGALTTSDMTLTASKKYATESNENKQELFTKMETVLQETTLQNIALRNDMKKLGAEVSRLSTKVEKLEKRNRELGLLTLYHLNPPHSHLFQIIHAVVALS